MTIDQMERALASVGACFAVTSAKVILPSDIDKTRIDKLKPSYNVYPDVHNPESITHIYSQEQLKDWVRTVKAVKRCIDESQAQVLWDAYDRRWV